MLGEGEGGGLVGMLFRPKYRLPPFTTTIVVSLHEESSTSSTTKIRSSQYSRALAVEYNRTVQKLVQQRATTQRALQAALQQLGPPQTTSTLGKPECPEKEESSPEASCLDLYIAE
jgi:hypothetical protein